MRDRGFIGKMLFMLAGLLVWAAHFTIIYAFTAVACAKDFAGVDVLGIGIVPFVIGAATLLALATTGAVLTSSLSVPVPPRSARFDEASERFMRYTAAVIAMLSLIAIGWNAVPVLIVNLC